MDKADNVEIVKTIRDIAKKNIKEFRKRFRGEISQESIHVEDNVQGAVKAANVLIGFIRDNTDFAFNELLDKIAQARFAFDKDLKYYTGIHGDKRRREEATGAIEFLDIILNAV